MSSNRIVRKLWNQRSPLLACSAGQVEFANDKAGWKLARSVGSIMLGKRGSRIILDDANSTSYIERYDQVRS
jgi:hypothetical protein